jgi:hypothetical protein
MPRLALGGCEHPERGVPPQSVVQGLEVLEIRVREVDGGSPSASVDELDLQAAPERCDDGVVVAVARLIDADARRLDPS